jgi:hypothetical protein
MLLGVARRNLGGGALLAMRRTRSSTVQRRILMQTKNSQQRFRALTTFSVRTLMCAVVSLSCGGKTPSDAATADPANAGGNSRPDGNLKGNCLDVVFQASPEESTGMIACPSKEGEVFQLDLFSSRAVACDGRGIGLMVGVVSCDGDADCPAGTSCGLYGSCYEPAKCEDDSQCGPHGACACASMFAAGSAYGTAIAFNQCLPAECRSDSDCDGFSCGLSDTPEPCDLVRAGFFCHSSRDECMQNSDCGMAEGCLYEASSRRWTCRSVHEVFCD